MKKILYFALAAMTLVACNKDKKNEEQGAEALKLNKTSLSMKVGDTEQLTANIAVDEWSSSDATVASVEDGLVTALKAGNAVISAKAGTETKTCVVLVTEEGGDDPDPQPGTEISAKRIWPVILDAVTAGANEAKIAGDFRVNDVDNFLYIWPGGESYQAGAGTGKNFFANSEGYVSLLVAQWAESWSGLGFCVKNDDAVTAGNALIADIVANPDKFFLHIAIKSTDNGSHQMYIFNDAAGRSFVLGATALEADKNPYMPGDFERDGDWQEYNLPMSQFVTALSSYTFESGHNILCALSGGTVGIQLNLDAIYFYEVED